ncbi:MAG: hypothetical protein O9353_02050 [Bacteroidia bacterium]|nr:hypothetical protein [Bacteroidia bacterium]
MKSSLILSILVASALLASCKKEYVCECTNPGGSLTAFRTKDTKRRAEQKCDDYYTQNYGSVVFNETSCKIR